MLQPPTLLTILQWEQNYVFQVEAPEGRKASALNIVIQTVSPQVRQQLEAAIEAAAHTLRLLSGLDRGVALGHSLHASDSLRRLGRLMHDLLLPSSIQAFLGKLTSHTPLLISTNDPLLPWELVHDGIEFLALKRSLGRRFLSAEQVRWNPVESHAGKNFLLIANPTGDLKKASEEIEALMDLLDALPEWSSYEVLARQGATKSEVLSHLSVGRWDLIHYSGHVVLDESRSQVNGLLLANGEVLTAEEIHRTIRGQPLIFLNGCSSAVGKAKPDIPGGSGSNEKSVPSLNLAIQGLASAFLLGGALGFIGTLWPVYDEAAYRFAVRFYRSALRGESVGQALQQAREFIRQKHPTDPIWASFVFYGDPTLRIAEITGQDRRLVTSLYARIDGLTELFCHSNLEEAASIQDAGLKLLAQEIAAGGGEVNSLSQEVIVATFGAPQAYGDDAQRAVRAALSMQQAWERFNQDVKQRTGTRLSLSLALSTGEVIAGQSAIGEQVTYTVRGQAVDLVVRLGQWVPTGQIWAEEHTYRLTNHAFDFASPEQPIPQLDRAIYRLTGSRPQRTSVLAGEEAFVGRQEPLAALRQCWQRALSGDGALITVVGIAGVGKSRLIETWRTELPEASCRWLEGTCQPQANAVPYGLMSPVLHQLFGLETSDDKATIRARIRATVDRMARSQGLSGIMHVDQALALLSEAMGLEFPGFPADDVDSGVRRGQLTRVIQGLLALESAEIPLIVVLEDMHWADEASLAVIDRLAEGIAHLPVLLIALYRPQWEHGWSARQHHHQIVLGRLTEDESRELLCDLLETTFLPPGLAKTVLPTAGGNPLFLKEMVRSLAESGALVKSNGVWQAAEKLDAVKLPTTIQATLQARVDRLEEHERQVLRMAAVLGLEFAHDALAVMAGSSPELAVDAALDTLRRQEFTTERAFWPEMRYVFQHALIQQVAYEGLLARQRKQLHRQAGQALEALYTGERQKAHLEQLAYHFYEGEAWAPALAYQLLAGGKALALFAYETARGYFERAKALIEAGRGNPSREQRLTCFESLGDAYTVQGRFEAAREGYQAALELPRTGVVVTADLCRKMAQTYGRQGKYGLAKEWLQRGLLTLGDRQDDAIAARIYLLWGIIDARQGRLDQVFGWAERALRAVEDKGAPAEEAQAYNLMGVFYRSRGELDRAAECCQHSAELYEALNNPLKAAAAYSNLGVIAFERDDWLGAEAAGRQALKLQESTDDAYGQATTHCNLADPCWRLGRLEEALAHAQAGLRLAREIKSDYLQALAHENLAAIYLRQGGAVQVSREHLKTSWRLLEEHDIQELRSEVQSLLADAYRREGRLDEAVEAGQRALKIAQRQESPLDEGVARRALGQVYRVQGDQKRAETELQASLEVLEHKKRRYEMARTLKELAALYAEGGAQQAAQTALERALAIFEELGARLDLEKAQALS